jgi:uncharacterized repeat protein (TIGR02543 family)
MKDEKLTMKKEKRGMRKILLCSLLTALCYLIFGCQEPSLSLEQENFPGDLPDGKGSFSLSINMTDAARTILPINHPVENDFALYTLKFTLKSNSTVSTVDREPAVSSGPVYLDPGTYTLEVTAFLDETKTKLAARGSSTSDIVINAGQNTTGAVLLKAIIEEGKGGYFKYTVTLPTTGLATATMAVNRQNTSVPVITPVNLLSSGAGTLTLNSGFYDVIFTLKKTDDQTLVWRELLHIYANLESVFTHTFNSNDFYRTAYAITFNANGGTPAPVMQNINHGGVVTQPGAMTKTGNTFDGWFKEAGFTTSWNFATDTVIDDITLYAKWTPVIYAVTFNADGGTPAPAQQDIAYGGTVTQPSAMTKTGYTFGGWYKEAAFTNTWNFATDTVTGNTILYAKWTPNSAVITITVEEIEDKARDLIANVTISRTGTGYDKTKTFTLADAGLYSSIEWTIDGVGAFAGETITGNEASFTVDATNPKYNSIGGHPVYLLVKIGDTWYSKTILVTIVQ